MELIELPSESVLKYISDSFGKTSGLAAHFQSFLPTQYYAHALVPKGTPLNRALEFNRGGLFSMSETQQWLFERLKNLCKQYKGGTFFAQDIGLSVEDRARFLSNFQTALFGYDSSAYFWLSGDKLSYDRVRDTLGATRSGQLVAAFTSCPLHQSQIAKDFLIDGLSFKALLSGIQEYYMRAYDEESFILLGQRQ